jgi:hypothetical protein
MSYAPPSTHAGQHRAKDDRDIAKDRLEHPDLEGGPAADLQESREFFVRRLTAMDLFHRAFDVEEAPSHRSLTGAGNPLMDRVHRELTNADIAKIVNTYHSYVT